MTLDEADKRLMYCDGRDRFATLYRLIPEIGLSGFRKLLGEWWSLMENIGFYKHDLLLMLEGARPIKEMMTEEELAFLDTLPEVFTIYRGCHQRNKKGLSWTLSKEVANFFALRFPHLHKGNPILITAEVKKEDVIAVKLCREELEIITWQPKIISVCKIAVPEEVML